MGCGASVEVFAIGELLAEIMRKEADIALCAPGDFAGPYPSGAPAIFADAVAKLGRRAGLIGSVGDDDFGRCCVERLVADGVETSGVKVVPGYTTGTAFISYSSDGTRRYVFHLRYSASALISVADVDQPALKKARVLHICGSALAMNQTVREACYEAISVVKKSGGLVTFDPNLRRELLSVDEIREICIPVLGNCDVLLPSGEEAALLVNVSDPISACERLLELDISVVALKQGSLGSIIFLADREIKAPAFKVTPIDPTGAGDCYDAAFVVGMLERWDLEEVALFANAAGALATTKLGPMEGTPSREQALAFMAKQGRPLGRKGRC